MGNFEKEPRCLLIFVLEDAKVISLFQVFR